MLGYGLAIGLVDGLAFTVTGSLVVVSGAGAAIRSNRGRVFHLLGWATLLAVILNRAGTTIG